MATLKSNNIRLTSALQESTANVDEWKRQLHTYKEENLRLKRDIDAIKPGSAGGSSAGGTAAAATAEANDELRRETILLKSRIQSLEKEMLSTEIELKAANKNLAEKSNDQSVSVTLITYCKNVC